MIMPFIRLISIYVVVIVAVVAVFKRDQIGELTGISMPWTQAEVVEQSEPAQQAEPTEEVATVTQTTTAPAESTETAETPDTTPAVSEPVEQAEIKMPTADAAPATPVATEAPETTEVAAIAEPSAAPTTAVPAAPVDTAARLNEARKTFWNGDVAGAEVLYAALARDLPDNADVHGEFGNVLYAQRRYEEAADAYFATGKLLVANGTPAQVMPLINVLQSLAPQKAASLYAMMTN
ncbi:MAG: hypothetical protein COC12_13620 [Rhodobacteraceae bacterium]|nr:MAG: hypothetical protein COC12_13620 [Paracoccaceae bacterium]